MSSKAATTPVTEILNSIGGVWRKFSASEFVNVTNPAAGNSGFAALSLWNFSPTMSPAIRVPINWEGTADSDTMKATLSARGNSGDSSATRAK